MKLYQNPCGCWINLDHCNRFFIKEDYVDEYHVVAALDINESEEVTYNLSKSFNTEKEAQEVLDIIINYLMQK